MDLNWDNEILFMCVHCEVFGVWVKCLFCARTLFADWIRAHRAFDGLLSCLMHSVEEGNSLALMKAFSGLIVVKNKNLAASWKTVSSLQ